PAPAEVAADVVDDDLRALARQRERDTAADAPARAGDDRHFAREQRAHRTILRGAALTRPARECQLTGRVGAVLSSREVGRRRFPARGARQAKQPRRPFRPNKGGLSYANWNVGT